ncbi:alpha/beta hydrolase [Nocardia harenae]|uniref:alpha/beta hydrolase n=1 Tax=Nocardia harenae TaxID=358707 RepID=UPI000830546F|nr:alpha/beta hydrolase [Nocardia harenae]
MTTPRSTVTSRSRPVPAAASLRSRLAAEFSARSLRHLNGALPLNAAGIFAGRQIIAGVMAAFGPVLPGTGVRRVREPGVRGEWVRAAGVPDGPRAVYYLHGSGYVICSARTHRGLASRISAATGLPVFVVDYRLAPEHRFPAAADDIAAGYSYLLESGYRPGDLVLGGDSAGGHLALDLVLQLAEQSAPQPAGVFCYSPLMDLTFALAEERDRARPDPMAPVATGRPMVALYTAGQRVDSPRLRLTARQGAVLPPVFVQAAAEEMLAGDAEYLHSMLTAAGQRCELQLWPGRIHVFQALPLLVPEAAAALHHTATFVAAALAEADTHIARPA